MIRIYTIITVLLFLPLIGQAQTNISLQEAIDIALENNYQLKQAANNKQLADTRVFSAKADFLPSLSGNFNGSLNIGRQFIQEDLSFEDATTKGVGGSLNANVTVFNGFANIANLRQARVDNQSTAEENQRLKETVIFNTASRYLQVVLNEELLKIAESTLEASRSQLEQIRAQVDVGSLPTVDLFNQEATVASNELTVIQRENTLEVSKAQLIRIMQDDTITDIETNVPSVDELSIAPVNFNLNEMIDTALNNRSDFKAQQLAIESNEQAQIIARANLLPSVSASAGISSRWSDQFRVPDPDNPMIREVASFSDQFFDLQRSRNIGFSVSIPIFNRWNNRTNLISSKIQLKNSELELQNVRFQISEEVRQAYNDYTSIVKELESSQKSLIAAERAYETEQQRYEIGATTLIELNLANANYVQAQSERVQAVYNFIFQQRLLDYYIGRLDENIEIN
ncbi:TolC family protein [Rhodohalobacter sp. 8-1]|uniref:TolC family protein n=1 Tax=Rhodohalobacter sp. 8-1 TaxID=3131972 RepID=UPI0030ED617D